MVFSDWRQLPALTDAFQAGGVLWRGLVVWDKTQASRAPHTGYFRHQAEYVVWGSNGKSRQMPARWPVPGCDYAACCPVRKTAHDGKAGSADVRAG
ncbi:hypothetical protein O5699_04105 [Escherichia coli]|nr:hypothetical protein [Escherichia coli]